MAIVRSLRPRYVNRISTPRLRRLASANNRRHHGELTLAIEDCCTVSRQALCIVDGIRKSLAGIADKPRRNHSAISGG